ncbi:hypothetical protein HpBT274_06440 [Helicobacter pylori]
MSKVQMDTEEVREFVNHLERFKELLNDEVNGLSSHFNNLDSWQDAGRDRFSEVLDNLKSTFNEFDEAAQEQIAWLKERIKIIKDDLWLNGKRTPKKSNKSLKNAGILKDPCKKKNALNLSKTLMDTHEKSC